MEIAAGDYIGFIDSADWIEADYYEKLYNAAVKADADVAITGILKHRKHIVKTIVTYSNESIFDTVETKFAACKCPPDFHPVNKIYRRKMLLTNNIRFAENIMFEDIDFVSKCIRLQVLHSLNSKRETVYEYGVSLILFRYGDRKAFERQDNVAKNNTCYFK